MISASSIIIGIGMGVFLARIGRYWDCFEEIEEYEIEVSKVKRIRKMNKKGKEDTGSTNNPDQEEANDEKDLDLSSMQKLKPGRVATMDKTLYAKNIVLDDGDDNLEEVKPRPDTESSMSNINVETHNEGQGENYKAKLLKKKLERIRERRR